MSRNTGIHMTGVEAASAETLCTRQELKQIDKQHDGLSMNRDRHKAKSKWEGKREKEREETSDRLLS